MGVRGVGILLDHLRDRVTLGVFPYTPFGPGPLHVTIRVSRAVRLPWGNPKPGAATLAVATLDYAIVELTLVLHPSTG